MKRSWFILGGILVLLIVATLLVLRQPGERSSSLADGGKLVSYDSSAVDKMEIRTPQSSVVLEKVGGKWKLTAPATFPADENSVTSAIGKGRDLEIDSKPISDNPEKQGLYQVDSSGTMVRMFAKGSEVAAFRVGKPSQTYTENFVRREGSNEVYLAKGVIGFTFNRGLRDWRDKTIFKTEEARITNVRFQYGDTTFALALKDTVWRVDGDLTVEAGVKSFLSSIANFQTDEFVDTALVKTPTLAATIDVAGTQLRFYPHKDAGKYYVQSSASQQWFEIQGWKAQQVLKRKKDFLPASAK